MKPLYVHDCKRCTYLGTWLERDVYMCGDGTGIDSSLIARSGSRGNQYYSCPTGSFVEHLEMGDAPAVADHRGRDPDDPSPVPVISWPQMTMDSPARVAILCGLALLHLKKRTES